MSFYDFHKQSDNYKNKKGTSFHENGVTVTGGHVQVKNQAIHVAKQANVDKLEDARMGQGGISKFISAGTGIGGPTNPSTIKKGNDEKASNSSD